MSRIAAVENRPRAEVERLLLLGGVRSYNAGDPLKFRAGDDPTGENLYLRRQLARPGGRRAAVTGLRLLTAVVETCDEAHGEEAS